jgi:Tfp pilus assembly protein PilO
MNFNSKALPVAWPKLSKIILVMKLTAILIIAAFTTVSAKTFSQVVSLKQKNTSVEKILRQIENKPVIILCMISRMYKRPVLSTSM